MFWYTDLHDNTDEVNLLINAVLASTIRGNLCLSLSEFAICSCSVVTLVPPPIVAAPPSLPLLPSQHRPTTTNTVAVPSPSQPPLFSSILKSPDFYMFLVD
ncbi:hypothetical protein L2E82_48894 [Cichorium intybus]|uniref:Uncharacterized protein n=1 Tax=Cichorium intybus TaxID=13427 RepID=A0ACB8Z076_CICIN|nr:hypothetical protein L2E82_48894 [Cichorium intybus]